MDDQQPPLAPIPASTPVSATPPPVVPLASVPVAAPISPSAPPVLPPTIQPVATVPPVTPSGKKRVLIIEDERPLAHALELKLSHEGYEIHCSLTGVEGLREALTGTYSVILLDLIMPELDGFGLMEKLVEQHIQTPIIVLSNLGQEEDKLKAKLLGARDYFVKANTPIFDIVRRMKEVMA